MSTDRLVVVIKAAYWFALLVMAAMTIAAFLLLQHMMVGQQRDAALLQLSAEQKVLSQRVVFLALASEKAVSTNLPALLETFSAATTDFETNYDRLLEATGVNQDSTLVQDPGSLESVFYTRPHNLDYFSTNLAANGRRLVAALRSEIGQTGADGRYIGGRERARLDATVADATLRAYAALSDRIKLVAEERQQRLMAVHRDLFFLTMASIALIAVLIFRPMTQMITRRTRDLVEARNAMAHTAEHDSLTGLYNRAYLMANFEIFIDDVRKRGERLAVLQIDLDRFKQINDTLGHAAGDLVLVRTAERMRAVTRESDICVRLGGDEFIVVMRTPASFTSVQAAASRLLSRINEPVFYNGTTILPGASVGIAMYPDDAERAEDLIVHADLALYSAKRLGGGASAFFSGELRRELDHHKEFAADIKAAIADEAFSVFFQPQVHLVSGEVIGVEALVRWRHPVRGTISPGIFLPVADKAGLMSELGRIVMRKAVYEAARWHRSGIAFGRLAVNVSSAELREADFEAFLFNTLKDAGLPLDLFALEIVESVILDDEKTGIAHKLRRLRAAGIHLELDDFGTGYASLSHIDPKQIDRVKIDRRFVQDIDRESDNAKIVRAMSDLAQSLGIGVVAEGAETQAELDTLTGLGCPAVQGYAVSFPMPGKETALWLAQRAGLVAMPPQPDQAVA